MKILMKKNYQLLMKILPTFIFKNVFKVIKVLILVFF